jgi:hypothetical protein
VIDISTVPVASSVMDSRACPDFEVHIGNLFPMWAFTYIYLSLKCYYFQTFDIPSFGAARFTNTPAGLYYVGRRCRSDAAVSFRGPPDFSPDPLDICGVFVHFSSLLRWSWCGTVWKSGPFLEVIYIHVQRLRRRDIR